ncbi:MAG: alpha/beta fold hydrolase [Desulfobacterales bacterium]|nr:alpha/beta fold hydrolase [Desulfobacterales bacterium]
MDFITEFILWALSMYLIYCLFLYFKQRHILFPRRHIVTYQDEDIHKKDVAMGKIWLKTDQGAVESWLYAPRGGFKNKEPAPAMIIAHGNAQIIDFWAEEVLTLTAMGLSVMLIEYPGYGRSTGSPSQKSISDVFIKGYDELISHRGVDSKKIILFGISVGGGAVCSLAKTRNAAAMILVSTFTGIRAFASGFFAPAFLIRDPFDNLSVVKNYKGHVLVVHGTKDTIIPYHHGEALYNAAINGKMISYDADHNDCPPDMAKFWKEIAVYLKEVGIL